MLHPRSLAIRLGFSLVTLLGVTVLVFALLHAVPGGPLRALVGEAAGADPAEIRRAEALLGFDLPPGERYGRWVLALLRGDLGTSWAVAPGRPVWPLLLDGLASTLLLTVPALVLALAIGGSIGTLSALRPGSWADHGLGLASYLLGGAPTFWLGLLLVLLFAVELAWLPAGGARTLGHDGIFDRARYLLLPVLTLAAVQVAPWGRYVRSGLLEALGRDYVRTARAKGVPERLVVLRHALPTVLPTLLTLLALDVPVLIAGATVTEVVFSYPGLGRLLVTALRAHDWPLVQGIALLLGAAVIVANLTADIAIASLDPRQRTGTPG